MPQFPSSDVYAWINVLPLSSELRDKLLFSLFDNNYTYMDILHGADANTVIGLDELSTWTNSDRMIVKKALFEARV